MEFVQTPIQGVMLIKPKVWGDSRGYFVETWQKERYEAAGINFPFVQDNHSKSSYGILRGLHFQKSFPQGKLVSVSLGSVFDVAVDIRRDSPTFGQWYGGRANAGKPAAAVDCPGAGAWFRRHQRNGPLSLQVYRTLPPGR